jgi:exo-1,4-beta-D-glucosaminidase
VLAVRIHPLDEPGLPAEPQLTAFGPFGLNGGPTGDIGKNVTMQSSVGWDWIPAVRDRNMGIWQDVFVSFTGPVDVRFPHIVTDLPLPDTRPARLGVSAELFNASGEPVTGALEFRISRAGESVTTVRQEVTLAAGALRLVSFRPDDHPGLTIDDPVLWWPHDYGEPSLYDLEVRFTAGAELSDAESLRFGIREVGSAVTTIDGWLRRDFTVNGRRIQIKGGAWVPDMLLDRDRQRYLDELRLSREANFNMVRIWGGGITPPQEFFAIADELGLLVWHDFWITGDAQGTWDKGTRDWPLEGEVFVSNAVNTAKRLRNHPSLLTWTAGNEGYPRRELYDVLRNEIAAKLDGTRPFLPTSGYANPDPSWGLSWPDDHETGAYSGGPYHWVEPAQYYGMVEAGRDWLFKDEVGIPSVPPLASLERFIPDLDRESSTLSDTWGYHDAAEGNGRFSLYDRAIRERYGEPATMDEYAWKAQFLNAENYRAIFEAANHDLERTGGVILWKTNAAWPSVIWQVYDWYLRPNAGYYYARNASRPLHVQLHPRTHAVSVINARLEPVRGLTVDVEIFDANARRIGNATRALDVGAEQSREVLRLGDVTGWNLEALRFVRLTLRNDADEMVADNFYWVAPENDFSALNELPHVELEAAVGSAQRDSQVAVTLVITNPTEHLAFFVNPVLAAGPDKDEVLPTFWNDNYFSLLPGETRTVVATVDGFRLAGRTTHVRLGGWNVRPADLRVGVPK